MSIAASYRRAVTRNGGAFGHHDDRWLALALVIESLASLPPGSAAEEAGAAIRGSLPMASIERESAWELGRPAETPGELIFLAIDEMQEGGAYEIAESLLVVALRIIPEGADHARLLALRGKNSRKRGLIDFAGDQYEEALRLARLARSREVMARALLGLAAIAQARGNYPAMARLAARGARQAAHSGARRVEHQLRLGLVASAARQRNFADAIRHGWRMLELAGDDPTLEGIGLQSLGQLLLEMGRVSEAVTVLGKLFHRRLPAASVLASLGSFAVATARLGAVEKTRWALGQIDGMRTLPVRAYPVADALVEAATAAALVGDQAAAEYFREHALAIAEPNDFHEFVIRAEELSKSTRVAIESPRAAKIMRTITAWEPEPLPERAQTLERVPAE